MRAAVLAVALAMGAIASLVEDAAAASGTTCLCRTEDAKSFAERTLRHGRWACDVKLGYVPAPDGKGGTTRRPASQTCNSEEIAQFRVWLCLDNGCTYPYIRSAARKNDALKRIEPLKGERRP